MSEIIDSTWPYDGPHTDETVTSAAEALPRLVRYLNNATRPGNAKGTLAYASTTYQIVSSLVQACELLPQLLTQLSDELLAQVDSGTLRDDRSMADADVTAEDAAAFLGDSIGAVHKLTRRLTDAGRCASHLGNSDPVPAVSEQVLEGPAECFDRDCEDYYGADGEEITDKATCSHIHEVPRRRPPMRDIEIPDETVDRADLWSGQIPRSDLRATLAAAAPLILAAELDRLLADPIAADRGVGQYEHLPMYARGREEEATAWIRTVRNRLAALRTPAVGTPEPAGPRLREWTGSEGGHIYEVQPGWAIWAVSREEAEAEHARYNLDGQCSYGIKVEDLAYHGATEVPAVPPAEPGVGA